MTEALNKNLLLPVLLMALCFGLPYRASAQDTKEQGDPNPLELNTPLRIEGDPGDLYPFTLRLKKSQFVRVEVVNGDYDLIVELLDPSNESLWRLSSGESTLWRSTVSWVAREDGVHTLYLRLGKSKGKESPFVVLVESRAAEYADAKRLEAEARFAEGRASAEQGGNGAPKTAEAFEAAAAIWKELGDTPNQAMALFGLGLVKAETGKAAEAVAIYEQLLSFYREADDKVGERRVLGALGAATSVLNEYRKSVEYFSAAAKLAEANGSELELSLLLYFEAAMNERMGRFRTAIPIHEKALAIRVRLGDTLGQAISLNNIGNATLSSGDYDSARISLTKALELSKSVENPTLTAMIFNNLGNLSGNTNRFEEAIVYYESSLKLAAESGDAVFKQVTLSNLAFANGELGRVDKAVEFYKQSLEASRTSGDRLSEGVTLNNLGELYSRIGQDEKGLEYFREALKIHKSTGARSEEGLTLANIGTVFIELNDTANALKYLDESLKIREELGDVRGEATTLNNIAVIHLNAEDFTKAKPFLEKAVAIQRKIGNGVGEADSLVNLSLIEWSVGDKEKALSLMTDALRIFAASNARFQLARTSFGVSGYLAELGRKEESVVYGKKAINLFQEIRGTLSVFGKDVQKKFIADRAGGYRGLAGVMISIGRLAEAQTVLDLLKDEEYAGLTRAGEKAATVPYSLSEEKAVLAVDNLASLGRKRLELEKLQNTPEGLNAEQQKELDKVYDEIEKANEAFRGALAALKETQPGVKDKISEIEGQQNLTSALEDLQRETGEGAVAIYTVIGTDEGAGGGKSKFGWAVLVTPKESKAYPIDVEGIEDNVFKLREALSSPAYDPQPLAKKLYDRVFRYKAEGRKTTLEEDLKRLFEGDKSPTLMWSLDGVLRYVPTAALHDGERYLVERYRHVTFNRQSLTSIGRSDRRWSVLGLGVSEAKTAGGVSFTALPGAEKELKDLVRAAPEETGIIAGTRRLNAEFTKEEAIRLWQRGQYPVVHISSHFSFNPAKQEESFLLIGDGALYFNDIKNRQGLFNSVDLLALSACDTGMTANGKESESFAYLAQSLGAKTVLASLWKVSDAGTPELMTRFYKIRSQNPQTPKGEAFRQAQLSMLTEKGGAEGKADTRRSDELNLDGKASDLVPYDPTGKPRYAHPFYWSAFTLIGNWK